MTYLLTDDVLEPQSNWYRSQVRLPKTLSEKVKDYIDESGLPLNTVLMKLIDSGLSNQFSVNKNYGERENIVISLPTSVIALTPETYPELTLVKGIGNWMIEYHALRAIITEPEAKKLLDLGFSEAEQNKYKFNQLRNIIFTEWNAVEVPERYDMNKNPIGYSEEVRMVCSKYIAEFFQSNPTYQLIQIEDRVLTNKKGVQVVHGIRIWYSYPANEKL